MAHKLLLADDSATIQRVVELTFASEDIEVVTVSDGARAIEAIERAAPDIVLADVSMPGKNGYDVASFVRNDPARDRIPLVLLTGAFEPLDEARCDAIGRYEVLVKPFEPREIIGKVRELLSLPATDASDVPADVVAAEAVTESASAGDLLGTSGTSGADTSEAVDPLAPNEGESKVAATGEAVAADPVASLDAETPAAAEGDSTPDPSSPTMAADAQQAFGPDSRSEPDAASPGEAAGKRAEADSPPTAEAASVAVERVPQAGAGGSVLAESFKTFLAVEQGAAAPALPAGDGAAGPGDAAPALPDAVMDELVKRVLARLTDTVLQDAVAEVVSRIAERLAREEITRVSPGGE